MQIYGTWNVLDIRLEITKAETQMVDEKHSSQDLVKGSSVKQDANQ
jgi:hypothetical protein